jgi:hypothetical protein
MHPKEAFGQDQKMLRAPRGHTTPELGRCIWGEMGKAPH